MNISVCICTCNRDSLLAEVLESLQKIELGGALVDAEVEIVVVDNRPDLPGTRELTERAATALPVPVRYAAESERGISSARNRAVTTALERDADFIAFIDDDDMPRPAWLEALVARQREKDADLVFGAWTLAGASRGFGSDSGVEAPEAATEEEDWTGEGGLPEMAATCNVLISSRILRRMLVDGPAFSLDFNGSGGGDAEFFLRSRRYQAVHAAAPASIIIRRYDDERRTLKGMLRRGFKNGSNRIVKQRMYGQHKAAIRAASSSLLKFIGAALTLPFCLLDRPKRIHRLYRMSKAAGVLYTFVTNRAYQYYLHES